MELDNVGKLRIGWIGLGAMGAEMARNLQVHRSTAGLSSINVHNRTMAKCEPLAAHGAVVLESASAVANASDVVFLSLFNDDAVKSVIGEILGAVAVADSTEQPLVIADMTTVHPSTTQWVLDEVARYMSQEDKNTKSPSTTRRRPVEFSQTPVWGAPPAAKAARLVFVSSGGAHRSILESIAVPAFARTSIDCGENPVRAAKFKILGNFMIAAVIESLGQAMAVAEETGIGRELYNEFVKEVFPIPPVAGYAAKMTDDGGEASKTRVNFSVPGGMKDVGYAIDLAKSVGMRLPVAELAYEHLEWVLNNGDPSWDWSSLVYALRKTNMKKP
ncbi:hypothetical protein GGI04_001311 [Coemansia thaxteri]|nr:hypothetical protein GGI04_001311 [Coemansia thaxteri]KAJ2470235.1 hypothetical protein GGI02_003062 [Coemansia sp. RSA 2322]